MINNAQQGKSVTEQEKQYGKVKIQCLSRAEVGRQKRKQDPDV